MPSASRVTVRRHLVVVGLVALASSGVFASRQTTARQASPQQAEPRVDPSTMAALLRAAPGTWVVSDGRLTPAVDEAAVPVFVQADAYRRAPGEVRVPVVVGAELGEPWIMLWRVSIGDSLNADGTGTASELTFTGEGGRVRQTHEFVLPPGAYQVSVAIARARQGRAFTGTVVRQPLVVPDLSSNVLAASPVVLGEAVVVNPTQKGGAAFSFGATSLTPAALNRFRQNEALNLALRIYGWKRDEAAKPDVTVDYVFQQRIGARLRFFNKTKPQELNAKTLSDAFDGSAGVLNAGITLPLSAFPPGDFQVAVRIRDKRTQAATVQTARFVVVPS